MHEKLQQIGDGDDDRRLSCRMGARGAFSVN